MENKEKKLLFDILDSIQKIESYLLNVKDFEDYEKNFLIQDAVERNLEIIGEATKRLITLKPNVPISHIRKIIDTRNLISHGYDVFQQDRIWVILINDLPILKQETTLLLNN